MKAVKVSRALYTAFGLVLIGVGFVGVFVPGMPTTVFLILALFCFKKGSSRFERWLLDHPRFGPTLRDWEAHRAIRPKTKVFAIVTMWAFVCASALMVPNAWVVAGIIALAAIGTWYIASRPSIAADPAVQGR